MGELPDDVHRALDNRFGRGNYAAASRMDGDELRLQIEIAERPNMMFLRTLTGRPWANERVAAAWRELAAEVIERRR